MANVYTSDAFDYISGFSPDMESAAAAATLGFGISGKTNPEELSKEEAIDLLESYDGDWEDLQEPDDTIYCYYLDH
jgi:hypothetical protein